MGKLTKYDMRAMADEFRRIISISKDKAPNHYLNEDFYNDLKDEVDEYGVLHEKYATLVRIFAKFINDKEIDIRKINTKINA